MNIIDVNIQDLKNNAKNPRKITEFNKNRLKRSLAVFPKMLELRPLVVNKEKTVLGGNQRLKIIKSWLNEPDSLFQLIEDEKNNITADRYEFAKTFWHEIIEKKKIKVATAESLTDADVKNFVVLDNLEFGVWDFDMLANEWDAEKLVFYGLDVWLEKKLPEEELFDELFKETDKNKEKNNLKVCPHCGYVFDPKKKQATGSVTASNMLTVPEIKNLD